ncbi:MAG: restriction endonuclease subunit S [Bacteroidales bacterium]|nr:restriction endonuclease subunit S [Bacteroidales bacterium]
MKHDWEYRRLIDVCAGASTINWDTASSKQYIDLSSVDRESHKVSDTTTICKADAPSRAKQIVKMGDVIFGTTRPLLKRVCLVAPEYDKQVCSTGFCVLRPQKMVLPMWVYYCLQTDRFYSYIEPLQKGISYPAVSNDDVRNYVIPLPPLPVQEQICSLLDKLSRVIEAKKEQLKELDNLAQAIFYDMFGDPVENNKDWKTQALGDVCTLKAGKSIKASELSETINVSLFPCYGGNGVRGYIGRYSHNRPLPIIGRQGALCGNVNFAKAPFYATEHAVVVTPKTTMDVVWLFFVLKLMHLNQYAHGVAQPGLSVQDIEPLPLIIPPLPLQQAFAEKVEAIERQKELINQSIREVQTLFDSRMDYWFSD